MNNITQAPEGVEIDFAPMTHAPDMELRAENQRPKTRDWSDLRLMHYAGTNLYQWYGKQNGSVFEDGCDTPFMIRALSVPVNGQGSEPVAWRCRDPFDGSWVSTVDPNMADYWRDAGTEVHPLYAAQQAPISDDTQAGRP